MKVTLKNFRCHRDAEYDIPDTGLILLSGPSGSGKSTIIEAITYALYGAELVTKPYSHGTKTCSVTVSIGNMVITRKSSPNTLEVAVNNGKPKIKGSAPTPKVIQADEAQEYIKRELGMSAEEFTLSSYVRQGFNASILSLTPSKQLELIETIAFGGSTTHVDYKNGIKTLVQRHTDEQTALEAQISLLESQIEDIPDNQSCSDNDQDDLPKGGRPSDDSQNAVESIEEVMKENRKRLADLSKQKGVLEDNLDHVLEAERKQDLSSERTRGFHLKLKQLHEMKASLEPRRSDDEIELLEQRRDDLSNKIDRSQEYHKMKGKLNEFKAMKKKYFDDLKERKTDLTREIKRIRIAFPDGNLEQHLASLEEQRALVEERKGYLREGKRIFDQARNLMTVPGSVKRISDLLKILNSEERKIKSRIQEQMGEMKMEICSQTLSCPKCSAIVHVEYNDSHDSGVLVSGKPKTGRAEQQARPTGPQAQMIELKDLQQKSLKLLELKRNCDSILSKLSSVKVPKSDDLESRIELVRKGMERIKECQKELDSIVDILENESLPPTMMEVEKSLTAGDDRPSDDIEANPAKLETLVELLGGYTEELEEVWRVRSEHERYDRDIQKTEDQLSKVVSVHRMVKVSKTIQRAIDDVKHAELSMTETIAGLTEKLSLARMHEQRQQRREEWEGRKKTLVEKRERLAEVKDQLLCAQKLERVYKQAENVAIEKTIASINSHAGVYLERMFEDPIVVRLENERTLKTKKMAKKLQMNVYVEYKGSKYDKVTAMSGGELQRVNLAFILAINDLLGSNRLFLDECTNNLDSELSLDIFMFLKELCGNKQIIVITHEEIKGAFDSIVQVSS